MTEPTIVSFPKSGRTWVKFALAHVGVHPNNTHAGSGTGRREIGKPFQGIPPHLSELPILFLHRDPIDTAVSLFFHITRKDLRFGSPRYFRMFLPLFIKGRIPPQEINEFVKSSVYGVERICKYNRAWIQHLADRQDSLIMTYESIREQPENGFHEIFTFLGLDIGKLSSALEASSFDAMKKVEQSGSKGAMLQQKYARDPLSAKVRRGKVGGYVDYLGTQTIEECKSVMVKYGF